MLRKARRPGGGSNLKNDLLNADLVADIILQSIEDAVILIGADDRALAANLAAGQITGQKVDRIAGKKWGDSLKLVDRHGIALAEEQNPLRRAFASGKTVREDGIFVAAAGGRLPVHLIASPLTDHAGKTEGVVCVMRDMSKEWAAEEAKTDFISTASHEMRTPLAALEGYLSLILENKDLSGQTAEYAAKAHQSVMHLGKLFRDLLTASQSDDGRLSHQPQVFAFNDLLQLVVAENQRSADAKQIVVRLNGGEAAGHRLNADPQRIKELFNNLLDNAIKYTDPGGRIDIAVRPIDGFIQAKVEDSGYGVPPKDLPHLFQKFYRVDNGRPGLGLGLFICKKIVELYGGDIWLESEVGRGSIFYVNLPRHGAAGKTES